MVHYEVLTWEKIEHDTKGVETGAQLIRTEQEEQCKDSAVSDAIICVTRSESLESGVMSQH